MSDDTNENVQKLNIPDDIAELIISIFGTSEKGELWLNTPINAFNYEPPIYRLNTCKGIKEIKVILNKIASGEFS